MVAVAVAGLTVAIIVIVFADKGAHPTARMARCSMGFLVAIVWIMAIADEVVQVLQVSSLYTTELYILTIPRADIWFHLRTIRCYHWFDYLRSRQLSCRSCCKHECSCESPLLIANIRHSPLV
jgi:hypothetical protein